MRLVNHSILWLVLISGAAAGAHEHNLPPGTRASHGTLRSHYRITDLGSFQARQADERPNINERGQVAAWQVVDQKNVVATSHVAGHSVYQGQLSPLVNSFAFGINDEGQLAGILEAAADLRWTHAFWYDGQVTRELPSLGGETSAARAIGRDAVIVGNAATSNGRIHAVWWQHSVVHDLGVLPGGDLSRAFAMGRRQVVVGEANDRLNGKVRATMWSAGRARSLGVLPGGSYSSALAVNSRDQAVGYADDDFGKSKAVLFDRGRIKILGTLGEDPSSALDINDGGQIVGTSSAHMGTMGMEAFLWERGHMLNLNQLIPPNSGWHLMAAYRITTSGQILAYGFHAGRTHLCLLAPY